MSSARVMVEDPDTKIDPFLIEEVVFESSQSGDDISCGGAGGCSSGGCGTACGSGD